MSQEADIRLQEKIVATSNDAEEPTTMSMTNRTSALYHENLWARHW